MQRLETSAFVKTNSEFFTVEVKLFNKCGVNSYDHWNLQTGRQGFWCNRSVITCLTSIAVGDLVVCRLRSWHLMLQREHWNALINIFLIVHMLLATQLHLLISFLLAISWHPFKKLWQRSSWPAIHTLRGTSGPLWTNLISERLFLRSSKLLGLYHRLLQRVKPSIQCQLILILMHVMHLRRKWKRKRRRLPSLLQFPSLLKLRNLWRMWRMRRRLLWRSQRIHWTPSPLVQWSWTTGSDSTPTPRPRIFILQSMVSPNIHTIAVSHLSGPSTNSK